MTVAGEIIISVVVENTNIRSLQINSTRSTRITELFANKTISEVEQNINLLFQLCNTAHRFSFLQLLNKNQLIKLSDNELLSYRLLLDIETIKEHCFSIASKWNRDKTIDKNVVAVLTVLNKIKERLFSGGDGLSLASKQLNDFSAIAPFIDELDNRLHDFLLGGKYCERHVFSSDDSFKDWVQTGETKSADFFKYLQQHKLSNLGATKIQPLPLKVAKELSHLLKDQKFICRPNYQNVIYESTPFSRLKNHSLIEKLGNGIVGRYVAQLVEIFVLLNKIKRDYKNMQSEIISYNIKTSSTSKSALVCVEAARGKLIHQTKIKKNQIVDYQILSPTQWNFHPQGVLNTMIKALTFSDKHDLKRKISLLVVALDPCVGCNVIVK